MIRVERHYIKGSPEIINLCSVSKELYNRCNFFMRQAWFSKQRLPDICILVIKTQDLNCFKNLHNTKTAKQTIRQCLNDWTNFKRALSAYYKNKTKFIRRPKPPCYKNKLAQVIFYNETMRKKSLKLGMLIPTNDCFKINSTKNFKQVVITPKTFGFIVEVQYEIDQLKQKLDKNKVASVDIGLNNLCTITSDQQRPILVNGRIAKSFNQQYNKKPCKKNSRKRYFRIENYFHHVSKFVVDFCIKNNIGKLIIGKNDGWKTGINHGKKNNQNFCYIPFYMLFEKIKYKAEQTGLDVIFTEEAYTSKASFLDHDELYKYEKGVEHTFSGKRKHRGLYVSKEGYALNADVNGSLNIRRKVIPEFVFTGIGDRSLAARPVTINPLKAFGCSAKNGVPKVVNSSNVKTNKIFINGKA